MAWLFFWLSIFGAICTLNVHRPVRKLKVLTVPSFLFGWLVGDLALFHLAFQVCMTVIFVAAGALESWPGQVGLAVSLVSWLGLLAVWPISRRAGPAVRAALDQGIGPIADADLTDAHAAGLARGPEPTRPLLPFSFNEPGVKVVRDVPYVDDGDPRHRLDLYLPERIDGRAPVLLQVHGGAWVIGQKREQALPLMYHLASRGWICVAANYRLSPKVAFPAHIIDLKRATAWIKREIARYGGDPEFVCVTGGSAGGHLSALLALSANDPAWQPGFEDEDTRFQACVPFYGVYDWTNEGGHQSVDMTPFLAEKVMQASLAAHRDEFLRASPLHRIHADAPPFFVIHGDSDSLTAVEEARVFATRLREVSNEPVAYAEIPGAQHAFEIFHTVRTQQVLPAVERFLGWAHTRALRGRGELRSVEAVDPSAKRAVTAT